MNENKACELLAKMRTLTLAGKNEEGDLEWIGTQKEWDSLPNEIESIKLEKLFL